jgi:Ca-activated chloride channel family protein
MSVASWLRIPRVRRTLAASAIVVSAGGLVLFHASAGAMPIAVPFAASTGTSASFSGPGVHGTMALSHGRVLAGGERDLFAEVRVVADASARDRVRAPLSLAVVLDTSGSMAGEKMDDAKASVLRLLREMQDDDEIAVVRYSDEAEVLQPLAKVGRIRHELVAKIQGLDSGGGTAIPRGLGAGLKALDEAGRGRVRRVVLVSDGLDSTRTEAERLARTSFEHGVTISSLGIGLDFDESYMNGVASSGHGNFGFVKDGAALAGFLQRELAETATTTAENVRVRVKLPPGVRFQRATGADARELDEGVVELRLGSLFAGDERRVLLELSAKVDAGDTKGLDGQAAWTLVGGGDVETAVPRIAFVGTSDARSAEQSRDPLVMASAISVVASRRQLEAAQAYSRGDTITAQNLIDKNLEELDAVRAFAPPVAAKPLEDQGRDYRALKGSFATAAPQSEAGKAAAKSAFAKDSQNLTRRAY